MAIRGLYDKNIRPFTAICNCHFGREVIYTNASKIDKSNIVDELNKALPTHEQNALEIDYLNRYYAGDQPIIYRQKKNRPEINNRVVVNIAKYVVDTLTAEITGEPIQYVLRAANEEKVEEIKRLNDYMVTENKDYHDVELARWQRICGTAYRFIGVNEEYDGEADEAPFFISTEEPNATFVVYDSNTKKPAFGCLVRTSEDNKVIYNVYTKSQFFLISEGKIIKDGVNGNGIIPVIEYPRNSRRLSDIECTISMTDEINKLTSDRSNAVEGYVCSWIKFINCDIDIEKFRQVRDEGFFSVTSNNGAENKSDVDIMSQELNQTEVQVETDDLFLKLLVIQGIANREGNSGGDTGSAVALRNGHIDGEKRAKTDEPIFKRSERDMLKIVLRQLRVKVGFTLIPADIEIKITRSKLDNALTKAEVLQILLNCGINPSRAIKTVELFSDPEQVVSESKEWLDAKYPTEQPNAEVVNDGTNDEE